jgi:hypothetical protein
LALFQLAIPDVALVSNSSDWNTPIGAKAAVAFRSRVMDFAAKAEVDVTAANIRTAAAAKTLPFAQGFLTRFVDWLEQVIQNTLFPR